MLPEDIRRLERESDIAEAVRGPDFRMRDEILRRVNAEHQQRVEFWLCYRAALMAGYWEGVKRGDFPAYDEFGRIRASSESLKYLAERDRLAQEYFNKRKTRTGLTPSI